jgi:hypothetical protein
MQDARLLEPGKFMIETPIANNDAPPSVADAAAQTTGRRYMGGGTWAEFNELGVRLTTEGRLGVTNRILIDWRTWFLIEERVRWYHAHTPSERREAEGGQGVRLDELKS